jgi:hypothetical protein
MSDHGWAESSHNVALASSQTSPGLVNGAHSGLVRLDRFQDSHQTSGQIGNCFGTRRSGCLGAPVRLECSHVFSQPILNLLEQRLHLREQPIVDQEQRAKRLRVSAQLLQFLRAKGIRRSAVRGVIGEVGEQRCPKLHQWLDRNGRDNLSKPKIILYGLGASALVFGAGRAKTVDTEPDSNQAEENRRNVRRQLCPDVLRGGLANDHRDPAVRLDEGAT